MKRSQVALEFFLVLTFFILMLFWFNNYYSQLRSQDLLLAQQKSLLDQIVLLEGEAFSSNQTLSFQLPCLVSEGKAVPFWVYGGSLDAGGTATEGTNETVLLSVLYSTRSSLRTSFPVKAASNPLLFECNVDNAGKIVFSRERVTVPGGSEQDGVVLRKG